MESGLGIESPQVITAIAQRLEELTQSGKLANNTMKVRMIPFSKENRRFLLHL